MVSQEKRGQVTVVPFTDRERLEVYRRLTLLNGSFSLIAQLLDELAQTSTLSASDLRAMRGRAQQIQLELNTKLLNPLESAEQSDHAQFGKVGITSGKETQRQISRSNVQVSPVARILLTIFAAITVLLVFATLRLRPGADWVYYSQDGMPAPCPPPNRGFFPADCH